MQCTLAELMNLVMAELSLKGSKGSVLTVEQTSSKRKSFEKKKKYAKKQKVDGKRKKMEPKKKAAEKKKIFPLQFRRPLKTELSSVPDHPEEQEG